MGHIFVHGGWGGAKLMGSFMLTLSNIMEQRVGLFGVMLVVFWSTELLACLG